MTTNRILRPFDADVLLLDDSPAERLATAAVLARQNDVSLDIMRDMDRDATEAQIIARLSTALLIDGI